MDMVNGVEGDPLSHSDRGSSISWDKLKVSASGVSDKTVKCLGLGIVGGYITRTLVNGAVTIAATSVAASLVMTGGAVICGAGTIYLIYDIATR